MKIGFMRSRVTPALLFSRKILIGSPILEIYPIISPGIGRVICFITGFPAFFTGFARDVHGKDLPAGVTLGVYSEKPAAIRAGTNCFSLHFNYAVRIIENPAVPFEPFALLAVFFPNLRPLPPNFERFFYDSLDVARDLGSLLKSLWS